MKKEPAFLTKRWIRRLLVPSSRRVTFAGWSGIILKVASLALFVILLSRIPEERRFQAEMKVIASSPEAFVFSLQADAPHLVPLFREGDVIRVSEGGYISFAARAEISDDGVLQWKTNETAAVVSGSPSHVAVFYSDSRSVWKAMTADLRLDQ